MGDLRYAVIRYPCHRWSGGQMCSPSAESCSFSAESDYSGRASSLSPSPLRHSLTHGTISVPAPQPAKTQLKSLQHQHQPVPLIPVQERQPSTAKLIQLSQELAPFEDRKVPAPAQECQFQKGHDQVKGDRLYCAFRLVQYQLLPIHEQTPSDRLPL